MSLVSVLSLAAALLAPQSSEQAAMTVFEQGCLQMPASRATFAATAARRGWRRLSARPLGGEDWSDAYQAGGVIVHLDHTPASSDTPEQLICVAQIGKTTPGWKARVSAMQSLGSPVGPPGEYDRSVYQLPPELELTIWDLADGSRIHALMAGGELELSVNYPAQQ